jgi:hypothetical protein
MRAISTRAVAWLLSGLVFGCGEGSADPGLSARLHVDDALFVPGAMPAANGGPAVASVNISHNDILPGLRAEQLQGTLGRRANAVLMELEGDPGYWIVNAQVPTVEAPELPSFGVGLAFSNFASETQVTLVLHAVGLDGRVGPARRVMLHPQKPEARVAVLVRLRWDTEADLDLHVVDPSGVELWAGDINSYLASGANALPSDSGTVSPAGVLDLDSNGSCLIDGRREENVFWTEAPRKGRYTVRVATASMCDESVAHWEVQAWVHGKSAGGARGWSVAEDTRAGAQRGDGTFAFSFRVP